MSRTALSRVALPALAAALLLAPAVASAADWRSYTSPVGNVSVATAGAGSYTSPVACSDGRGGMWVAYVDVPSSGDTEIQLRRITGDGTSDVLRYVTSDSYNQDQPQLCPSDSGGVFVVWRDSRNSATTGDDIYVQYVGPEGLARWTANGVQVTNASGAQQTPFVGKGYFGLIVGWLDDRNGSANSDVYFGRVNYSGVVSSLAGNALSTDPSDAFELSGTPALDGLYLVWRDARTGNNDVYGDLVYSSGTKYWSTFGTSAVCIATGQQYDPCVTGSGTFDGWVAWEDVRGADYDIYVQRMSSDGDPQYGASGTAVSTASLNQFDPEIASDGAGGAIIAWLDDRAAPRSIYAQRVAPNGQMLWTANGADVASGILGTPTAMRITSDGLGGLFVVWAEARVSGTDLYGQRLSSGGSAQWGSGGVLIAGSANTQTNGAVTVGLDNSLLVAFEDERQGAGDPSIYAQRVDRWGYLGGGEPKIVDVSDVPGDQGGKVRLDWLPGYVEFDPYLQVTSYYVLRQVPASLAASLQRAGAARLVSEPAEPAAGERVLLAQPSALGVTYWEYVGQAPAFQADAYSYVAPTTSDSVAGVPASTQFMVQARNSSGSRYWFSNVKVGHSLDNLAPAAPAPFAGTYSGGASVLTWNPNVEPDLAGYRLYRGSSASFTPSEGNLVAALADTGHVDAAGAPYWYKLTAVDVHGNESPVSTLLPSGTTAVEAGATARAFFALGSANPVRAGGATTLRFGLAVAGRASLALYDTGGRRVRELATGTLEAGEHTLAWDGRDEAGRLAAPGLYFARFETAGFTATRKLVVRD